MVQIYKNLFFDEKTNAYFFISDNDNRQVVSQESYLLIYLLEVLLKKRDEIPFLSNEKEKLK